MQNRPHTSVQYKINKSKLNSNFQQQQQLQSDDHGSNNINNHNNVLSNNNSSNIKTKSPIKQHNGHGSNQYQNQNSYSLSSNNSSHSTQLPDITGRKNQYQNFLKNKHNNIGNFGGQQQQQQPDLGMQNIGDFQEVLLKEKDERYRYLLKHGTLKRIENNGSIIFSELPQIPGIWVCYRRPQERDTSMEKLNLDYMELQHIPLLEGEEKLKILTYQHNKVLKIENLVSLPTLLYLDLYDNQIKEIENLNSLPQLRVLLLPKNQITKIKNVDMLQKLEVLDLHSNKIQKIEGINKLQNLRILNLANNLLCKIENLENQVNLVELNLKINLIEGLENIGHLQKLEKLFVSNNKISSLDTLQQNLPKLSSLQELNLDGNPVQKQKFEYLKCVLGGQKKLQILDHKNTDQLRAELKDDEDKKQQIQQKQQQNGQNKQQSQQQLNKGNSSNNIQSNSNNNGIQQNGSQSNNNLQQQQQLNNNNHSKQQQLQDNSNNNQQQQNNNNNQEDEEEGEINPEEVIDIIGQQWEKELDRVKQIDIQNMQRKEILKNTVVEGGHAEIEDDSILFIFGNAYEIVLQNQGFQETIEKIQFQYILFDFLIEGHTLQILKNFRKLKEIVLKDNYVSSLLQLAKLETIPSLRSITIENSPLCRCSYLKEFIVYRFPHIVKINGKDVKEIDRQRAKQLFHHFDRILQLPEKFYNIDNVRVYPFEQKQEVEIKKDKHYMKVFTKTVNENADKFVQSIMPQIVDEQYQKQYLNRQIDDYLLALIASTLEEAS